MLWVLIKLKKIKNKLGKKKSIFLNSGLKFNFKRNWENMKIISKHKIGFHFEIKNDKRNINLPPLCIIRFINRNGPND